MEVMSVLGMICDKHLIMCIPLLLEIGFIIKHYTTIYNGFIPYIEACLGVILGIFYGCILAKSGDGSYVFNTIVYGSQGIVVGGASVLMYDAVHGVIKHKCKNPSEVIMEKKKFHPMEHAWFVYGLAIVESVIACGLIELVFHGKAEMLTWFCQYAHLTVIPCVAIDVMTKVAKERPLITWQYFVLEALIVLADVLFTWASVTTTVTPMILLLIATAVVVAGAVIWFNKWYKPAYEVRSKALFDEIASDLESRGLPAQYTGIAIDYFFIKGE